MVVFCNSSLFNKSWTTSSLCLKVVDGLEGREVQLINRKSLRSLTSQLLALLMSQEEEQVIKGLKVEELSQHYQVVHGAALNPCEYGFLSLSELLKSLPYLVEVSFLFSTFELHFCKFCKCFWYFPRTVPHSSLFFSLITLSLASSTVIPWGKCSKHQLCQQCQHLCWGVGQADKTLPVCP